MNQTTFFDDTRVQGSQLARINPRDYQQDAIDTTFQLFERGSSGVIIRQPTGSGKTTTGALIASRWCRRGNDHHVIVLAHERQLVTQFADQIEEILGERPGIEMSQEYRVYRENMPRIVVASRQSLYERFVTGDLGAAQCASRLYKFDNELSWLVILDECHRWALKLKSCQHILKWFQTNPHSRRIGLTATPERGDKVSLAGILPDIASDYRLYDLDGGPCAVRDGWAVSYDQRFVTVEGVDFKNLTEVAGDFDADELGEVLGERERLLSLVRPTLDLVGNRRTLIFSPTVAMARAVALTINAEFPDRHAAVSLDGSVPDLERRDVYRRHQRGEFHFLSVCGLCREGYNDPGIQAVAVFRPTKSRTLAEQMKGRGCRPLQGLVDHLTTADERRAAIAASSKPDCMIIDLVGITGMADCATTAHILASGKPDKVIERANRNALSRRGSVDMVMEIHRAEQEIEQEERERRRRERLERERWEREQSQRRARIHCEVRYTAHTIQQGHGCVNARTGFPRARMPFGKFRGELVIKLPDWYLKGCLNGKPKVRKRWLRTAIERELQRRRESKPVPEGYDITEINKILRAVART